MDRRRAVRDSSYLTNSMVSFANQPVQIHSRNPGSVRGVKESMTDPRSERAYDVLAWQRCVRKFVFLAVLVALPQFGRAATLLLSAPESVAPGAPLIVAATLSASASPISAIQFDLEFDASQCDLAFSVGDIVQSAEKQIHWNELDSHRKRFLLIGLNGEALPEGTLLRFYISVHRDASGSLPFRLLDPIASTPEGDAVSLVEEQASVDVSDIPAASVQLSADALLNGASLATGPVTPGEAITVLGLNFSNLERVTVGDLPAAVLYAGPNQANLALPCELAGQTSALLKVQRLDQPVATADLVLAPSAPGLFTADATGASWVAALHEDGSSVSPEHPATPGDSIVLFATGLGIRCGQGTAVLQIGGQEASILSMLPLQELPGVVQITAWVPPDSPSGPFVPVRLSEGDSHSQPGVGLAIR